MLYFLQKFLPAWKLAERQPPPHFLDSAWRSFLIVSFNWLEFLSFRKLAAIVSWGCRRVDAIKMSYISRHTASLPPSFPSPNLNPSPPLHPPAIDWPSCVFCVWALKWTICRDMAAAAALTSQPWRKKKLAYNCAIVLWLCPSENYPLCRLYDVCIDYASCVQLSMYSCTNCSVGSLGHDRFDLKFLPRCFPVRESVLPAFPPLVGNSSQWLYSTRPARQNGDFGWNLTYFPPIFHLWYPIRHFSAHMFTEFAYFCLFPSIFHLFFA